MSRKLMAILVSSTLAFGNLSTSAWSAPAVSGATAPANNQSPLTPGGVAGIKQAQGQGIEPWAAIAIVAGIFLVGVLLLEEDDDDDNGGPSTTGT
ncbi:MAG TPA: hypothetical protein VNT79_02475 [Phycisphaerae bacterium]|jgi:hypothetical protein|nr:hypothetical protein [Phycisphaerae bacterium]